MGLAFSASAQYRDGASPLEDLYDGETVRALKGHVSTLSGAEMEGRGAGSEGERMAAAYVGRTLAAYGIDLVGPEDGETFGIALTGADTLVSRNVVGFLPGADKSLRDHYIVIGARLDNLGQDTYLVDGVETPRIYSGASGNASGLAMMLELAAKLSTNRILLRRSVLFVAFGASRASLAGSWYFLNRSFSDSGSIDAMIDLDILGGSGGLLAYTSANADMDQIAYRLRGELLPAEASLITEAPYPSDHTVFYDREIPSVLFTTGRYPEHDTPRDTYSILDFDNMERALEYIYSYAVALTNGEKPLFRPSEGGKTDIPGTISYSDCDVKPSFLSGSDPRIFLEKWVYQYLKYPSYAVENGIQGRVMVDFVIDEKGNVCDVKVSRGVHVSLDEEAVRVISASPRWRPGRHRGKKVRVALTLPVEFRLKKGSDASSVGINGYKVN